MHVPKRLAMALMLWVAAGVSVASSARAVTQEVLADFEAGLPANWFVFNGASTVTTSQQTVADVAPLARPGQVGDNGVLSVDFNVTDFGVFGGDYGVPGPQDWSGHATFDFWFRGTGSGLAYQAEISDNRSDPGVDTSERFDYEFVDDTPGWRLVSIPFADFTRATDFQPAGAPDDGFTLTEIWAWAVVLPIGVGHVYFHDVALGQPIIDDFESGLAAGIDGDGNSIGFFTFNGFGASASIGTTDAPPAPVPGSVAGNDVLQVDIMLGPYAGLIHRFENPAANTWVSQDWSGTSGIGFWLYGYDTGVTLFFDVLDNRNPGSTTDDAERFTVEIPDDFIGWRYFEFPWTGFTRKEVGNGAPNDGFNLTEVRGWAFGAFGDNVSFASYIDDVRLCGAQATSGPTTIVDTTPGAGVADGNIDPGEYVGYSSGINAGFGDVIGGGSRLHVDTDTGGALTWGLATGGGALSDQMVIYIDCRPGGFAETAAFTDVADPLRAAISGAGLVNPGGRSNLVFPPEFAADFAIGLEANFAGLWELGNPANHTYLAGAPPATSGEHWEFAFTLADLGLAPGDSLRYVATYGNVFDAGGFYRSDEFHGVASQSVPPGNPGVTDVFLATGDFNTFRSYSSLVSVEDEKGVPVPGPALTVSPNPFNAGTRLAFELATPSRVNLEIFDMAGRHVCTLAAGSHFPAGRQSLAWRGNAADGRAVPSGVYLYRFRAGDRQSSGLLTLVK